MSQVFTWDVPDEKTANEWAENRWVSTQQDIGDWLTPNGTRRAEIRNNVRKMDSSTRSLDDELYKVKKPDLQRFSRIGEARPTILGPALASNQFFVGKMRLGPASFAATHATDPKFVLPFKWLG